MRIVKKITNLGTILFAIVAVAFGVIGAVLAEKAITDALIPTEGLIEPLKALISGFSLDALLSSYLAVFHVLFILLFVMLAITWFIIAIVCKRPGQIVIQILVTIFGFVALDMVIVNLGTFIETLKTVIPEIAGGNFANVGSIFTLGTFALFIGLLASLCYVVAVVFNIIWLFVSLGDYEYQESSKKQELLKEHKEFILEFRLRVEEAQAVVDRLTAFVKTDSGHAAYLRKDLTDARHALKDAKKALAKAEKKYISAKAKNDVDNKAEKELAEKVRLGEIAKAEQERKEAEERLEELQREKESELAKLEKEIAKQRALLDKELAEAERVEKEYNEKLGTYVEEPKVVEEKPVTKKPVAKKAPAKKPAAKKAPTKMPGKKLTEVKKVTPAPLPAPVVEEKVKRERISFEQRLQSADKALKNTYNEIKNEILSYGVKSRVSSSGDTFRLHTKTYVKMVVAGKSLKLYMALNPADYKDSPMPIGDASKKNLYKEIPLVFKVKSDLSVRRAKQLIAEAMAKDQIPQGTIENTTWVK